MILIVEDENYRKNWFYKSFADQKIHFTSKLNECIQLMKNNKYDLIFLDHDLDNTHDDGGMIATTMSELSLQLETPIIIHSDNDNGAERIFKILKDTHNVIKIPFYCFSGREYWLEGDTMDEIDANQ